MNPRLLFAGALLAALAACGNDDAGSTTGTTGGTSGATGFGGSGGGAPTAKTTPDPRFLPKPTGACPEFTEGRLTFAPAANVKSRDVEIWVSDAAKTLDGPIVFFWHGAGGSPKEAPYALSTQVIDAIKEQGGIVVAAYHDAGSGQLPWFLSLGGNAEDDLNVMDEVLACAIEKVGVDLRRIHSVGFSAGAMNTMQVGWRRSGYIASIVTYSGAQLGTPPDQDPENKFPAMTFHGGADDQVIIKFQDSTEQYVETMKSEGHFAFICDHGKGHTVPGDGRASAWQFLQDHPFGAQPEPYLNGLPAGFPSYCKL